ncbi:MAG: replication-associated recombination protein A [Eubacteriales bacterium]|nr:replication-associated recombination protein A [Eubacteriales bacterium]
MDLFTMQSERLRPLAERMRPRTLDEFIGQEHIVGKGRLLRRAIDADRLTSCIFYGPPGCGKTSLAAVIAHTTHGDFKKLNAVSSGVKELREILDEAEKLLTTSGVPTYLLLDECHRWSTAQSDAILPALERGTVRLIGSTTENPFIAMTPAVLSRCRIFQFLPLTTEDVLKAMDRALTDRERGLADLNPVIDPEARQHIAEVAGGDVRTALNALELAVLSTDPSPDGSIHITAEVAADSIQKPVLRCDESLLYDMLSAFCKSLRGSDSDAALCWCARLLSAGMDPRIIARRLIAHASEDVGLADPAAMQQAVAAAQSVQLIGLPECQLSLAQAIIYLCEAPKSNSVLGYYEAQKAVSNLVSADCVPPHLRDTHYRGAEKLGSGEGYLYPHDFPDHYVKQDYMPTPLAGRKFYHPSEMGFEKTIKDRKEKRES